MDGCIVVALALEKLHNRLSPPPAPAVPVASVAQLDEVLQVPPITRTQVLTSGSARDGCQDGQTETVCQWCGSRHGECLNSKGGWIVLQTGKQHFAKKPIAIGLV
jgi:hypothetical protein